MTIMCEFTVSDSPAQLCEKSSKTATTSNIKKKKDKSREEERKSMIKEGIKWRIGSILKCGILKFAAV